MQNKASLRMLQYIQDKSSPKYPVFLLDFFFDEYRKATGMPKGRAAKVLQSLLEEDYIEMVRNPENSCEIIGFALSAKGSSYDEFKRVAKLSQRWKIALLFGGVFLVLCVFFLARGI